MYNVEKGKRFLRLSLQARYNSVSDTRMKFQLITCPRCGESDLVFQDGFYRCRFCGAMLKEEEKIDIEERIEAAMKAGKEADLGKLRFLLSQSVQAQYADPSEIRTRADDILRLLPEDIQASYFRAFFSRKRHRAEYQAWLKGCKEPLSPYHKKLLYPYIVDLCDFVDAEIVKSFLKKQGDNDRLKDVDAALKVREEEVERFSNVPRDVFVCHAHSDIAKILPLVERIEQDEGYSFWLSERNMPIDVENYKDNIKNAIKSCRLFLVFASRASMQSQDVHWELDIAEELGKEKRIEYRLEDRPNNIKFKHFFDGIQWIDGATSSHADDLAERIYLLSKKETPKQAEVEEPKVEEPKQEGDPNAAKLKAIELKIKFKKFGEAVSDIFSLLGEDENCVGAWKLGIVAASQNKKLNTEEARQFYDGLVEHDPSNKAAYQSEYAALFALPKEEDKAPAPAPKPEPKIDPEAERLAKEKKEEEERLAKEKAEAEEKEKAKKKRLEEEQARLAKALTGATPGKIIQMGVDKGPKSSIDIPLSADTNERGNWLYKGKEYIRYFNKNYPDSLEPLSNGCYYEALPLEWEFATLNDTPALICKNLVYGGDFHRIANRRFTCLEDSTLGQWLNGAFLNRTFNEAEKSVIQSVSLLTKEQAEALPPKDFACATVGRKDDTSNSWYTQTEYPSNKMGRYLYTGMPNGKLGYDSEVHTVSWNRPPLTRPVIYLKKRYLEILYPGLFSMEGRYQGDVLDTMFYNLYGKKK